MSSAIVIGAGPAGLAIAMLLAEAGLEVIVVEKDAEEPPRTAKNAWVDWNRPGVSQFRQSHGLLPRGLQILEERLHTVVDYLKCFGAHHFNLTDSPPPSIAHWEPQPEDNRFDSLAATRPLFELAFARAAEETANLEVRRGTRIIGLTTGAKAIPRAPQVTGVVTDSGEKLCADIVIDAGGRRSPSAALLDDIGAEELPESDGDFRFVYYTRYYRKTGPDFPQPYVLSRFPSGSVSIGTFPADNETWSVTLYGTNSDRTLRSARDPEVFERVIRAHPERAHFTEAEPISDIIVMAGVADRERRVHLNGSPIATGWLPVGDAWSCTNPILGRGITMSLMHAIALTPAIAQLLDRPAELADSWETITSEQLRPWYHATRDIDRARSAEMEAVRLGKISRHGEGRPPGEAAYLASVLTDSEVFRAHLEIMSMLTTQADVMGRTDIQEKVTTTARDLPDLSVPEIPTRRELEDLLT